jgi:bile acid:Na+ symporter, BASS family
MARARRLLRNRDFILFLSLALGLIVPGPPEWLQRLTLPVLAVVMTVSTVGVPNSVFRSPQIILRPAIIGVIMNYGILSAFLLATSALIIGDETFRIGFVLLAAVPPAVAVIPFTVSFQGNPVISLLGTVGGYLAALILTPVIAMLFLSDVDIPLGGLLSVTMQLIIVPLILSRLLLRKGLSRFLDSVRGPITNWGFFLLTYTVVGLNRDTFFSRPESIAPVALVAGASMFLVGYLIEKIARRHSVDASSIVSLVMLGTLKNCGLAVGLGLAFFSKEAALPATVSAVMMILFVIWVGYRGRQRSPGDSGMRSPTFGSKRRGSSRS